MKRVAVPRLLALTDEILQSRFGHDELADAAWAAGADGVQLRDKTSDPARRLELARRLAARRRGLPGRSFFVNDDPRLAVEADADGVHVGPEDAPPAEARAVVGTERLVGFSAGTCEEARSGAAGGADYLGVGPVFGSTSKADAGPALGLAELSRIAAATDLPVIAIGSITPERIASVLAHGAFGVAVLSAYALAPDPEAAMREAAEALRDALQASGRTW